MLLDELSYYVQNEVPVHLIYIPQSRLVDRNFVEEHFRNHLLREVYGNPSRWRESLPARPKILGKPIDVTDERQLCRFIIRQIVTYAILSHRWEQEEVTYSECISIYKPPETAYNFSGRNKLWRFLDAASSIGIQFAWADTCCIDKSSSAELDEAIRSMFRWYQNSALCVVHLAQTNFLGDMHRDEWFNRGWTLQELLAPSRIKFVNKDWELLVGAYNDKDNRKVTQIPLEVLAEPFVPKTDKINTKMRWAALRKTTRAEDSAYSLMGMLGVSIRTAYGEGRTRAFHRLIKAVVDDVKDLSVL
ncbi:hypothetical protein CONPUDRAFT_62502, partial [Coniophora puteana RWD-64-598 SS2]